MQHYTSGLRTNNGKEKQRKILLSLDSWIDIQSEEKQTPTPETATSSFADRDLLSSMHINENLLLEAQKESSRVGSKSSHSDRYLFASFISYRFHDSF